MLYTIVAIIIAAASFIFAMLGLGGGMVYVPVLNWAGFDMVAVAIPLGLLLNGLNTLLVLIPFARKKLVDWKGGAVMAVTALIAAPLGAMTSDKVPVHTLKILFAAMVIIAAVRMIRVAKKPEPEQMISFRKRSIIGFARKFLQSRNSFWPCIQAENLLHHFYYCNFGAQRVIYCSEFTADSAPSYNDKAFRYLRQFEDIIA